MRRSTAIVGMLVAAVLLSVTAAVAKPKRGREIPPEKREQVVRAAYARLVDIVAAGGETVELSLSGFETIDAEQFDHVFWLDVVTMPGGDMLDMVRESRQDESGERVVYRPQWNVPMELPTSSPSSQAEGMMIADVLAAVAEEQAEVSTVSALTTYEVEVVYSGHSRVYKSVVLWLAPRLSGDATLMFLDNITQGVEEALREPDRAPAPVPVEQPLDKIDNGSCVPFVDTLNYAPPRLTDSSGHWWGGVHSAELNANMECKCAGTCKQTCTTRIDTTKTRCLDVGPIVADLIPPFTACHKMGTSMGVKDTPSFDGRTNQASCQVGLGCVAKHCRSVFGVCSCTVGVSVSFPGVGVSFAASGNPDWSLNIGSERVPCPPCVEKNSAPDYGFTLPPPMPSGFGGFPCMWSQGPCGYVPGPSTCSGPCTGTWYCSAGTVCQ